MYCEENRRDPPADSRQRHCRLEQHAWPGNVRELENYVERTVVLSHGGPINFEHMVPGHEHRMRTTRSRAGGSLESMIQNLVRFALQTIPPEDGGLYDRLVRGVERELLEQVLPLCDHVLVKAAARLGINRNTLHKKISELQRPADPAANSQDVGNGGKEE